MATLSARSRGGDDFVPQVHVYEPHRAHLPPMRPYLREFWRRRRFAYELSRTTQKATHFDSPIGAFWLVLNPLLLAMVYYMLIVILRGSGGTSGFETIAHILIGLFTWYYAHNAMTLGATSVTAGGRLILNQAFPRALLPFSAVISSFLMYLPTLPVYLTIYLVGGWLSDSPGVAGLSAALLWIPLVIALLSVTAFGLALIFATMTVYFRDTTKLLSYVLRLWMYASPVLYTTDQLLRQFGGMGKLLLYGNPLGPTLAITSAIWLDGQQPSPALLAAAVAWAVVLPVVGGYLFISRERDFAVRL